MIDIHSHILFGVDDGAEDATETRRLLEESYRQGVRTIIATSHRRKGMFETPERQILESYEETKKIAAEVAQDLTILYGAEIYYTSDVVGRLEKRHIPTLAQTAYVLVEFSMDTPFKDIIKALKSILQLGRIPVVAHIERYHCLEDQAERVEELIDLGCYMQVNSVNVLRPMLFGDKYKLFKKRVRFFLEKDLVHFVASDMHNTKQRPSYMQEAYQTIAKQYGTKRADKLFRENQATLLRNELI